MRGDGRTSTLNSRTFNPYSSDKDLSFGYAGDPATFKKAIANRSKFENAAAKLIKTRASMSDKKPADVLDSFTKSMYRNPLDVKRGLSECTPEDFHEAFEYFASDGCILIHDVEDIVKGTLGKDVPQWILSKFDVLSRKAAHFKRVNWDQFRDIVFKVQSIGTSECNVTKAQIPDHLRPQTAPIGSGLVPYNNNSCYKTDYNATRFTDLSAFGETPKRIATTRELFLGTTKATDQLPGYGGHIPHNTFNMRKYEHSSGLKPRPQPCHLRLVSERLGSVPSYTGYIPMHTGLQEDRTTGMDPNTTTGAAYGHIFQAK
eukprot:CAMPEP_0185017700 /NCGR_PEP_ID=MMETSP1103-20130426/615_1 /TAXON_ID=36769 /ORGANISM="Paraphysomonas bandaiensis, Strain Caron Lab Isolate" /LENGTH=315 /DNA_ID=CAMNT_0027547237 /DNA_START=159 /DNA_END=1106 /DNA_ORIENTATION=+